MANIQVSYNNFINFSHPNGLHNALNCCTKRMFSVQLHITDHTSSLFICWSFKWFMFSLIVLEINHISTYHFLLPLRLMNSHDKEKHFYKTMKQRTLTNAKRITELKWCYDMTCPLIRSVLVWPAPPLLYMEWCQSPSAVSLDPPPLKTPAQKIAWCQSLSLEGSLILYIK